MSTTPDHPIRVQTPNAPARYFGAARFIPREHVRRNLFGLEHPQVEILDEDDATIDQ